MKLLHRDGHPYSGEDTLFIDVEDSSSLSDHATHILTGVDVRKWAGHRHSLTFYALNHVPVHISIPPSVAVQLATSLLHSAGQVTLLESIERR